MKINSHNIIDEFHLIPFGAKGWLKNDDVACPDCNRKEKLGFKFSNGFGAVHCFFCDYSIGIVGYLKQIGRTDLIDFDQQISLESTLKSLDEVVEVEEELPEVTLPRGYERIAYDSYLKNRGFKSHQYDEFEVGVTNHFLERRLHNYLIFVLRQKGRVVGWLARSKHSYEWHKQNLLDYKANKAVLHNRYINSTGTDFSKILGGFDRINERIEEVIIVEGLMDYCNVSNLLKTDKSDTLKVVFTFGNKVSEPQLKLLRETKVKRTIIMYDYNTDKQSRQYSTELSKYFESYVCDWPLLFNEKNEEIDPGNCDTQLLNDVLSKRQNFLQYYNSKLLRI